MSHLRTLELAEFPLECVNQAEVKGLPAAASTTVRGGTLRKVRCKSKLHALGHKGFINVTCTKHSTACWWHWLRRTRANYGMHSHAGLSSLAATANVWYKRTFLGAGKQNHTPRIYGECIQFLPTSGRIWHHQSEATFVVGGCSQGRRTLLWALGMESSQWAADQGGVAQRTFAALL